MVKALDVNLASKSAEEYMLEELLQVGVTIIQAQLQAALEGHMPAKVIMKRLLSSEALSRRHLHVFLLAFPTGGCTDGSITHAN